MRTIKHRGNRWGYEVSIPRDWSRSLRITLLERLLDSGAASRAFVGPNGKFLHIAITPLNETDAEPTIDETETFFDGLSHRQSLHVIATGAITVADKEHFWATYYKLRPSGGEQAQFIKKYCLYFNRIEYLMTGQLYLASAGQKLPTGEMLSESERIYDEIVLSFRPLTD
jgi:hypothetical protein